MGLGMTNVSSVVIAKVDDDGFPKLDTVEVLLAEEQSNCACGVPKNQRHCERWHGSTTPIEADRRSPHWQAAGGRWWQRQRHKN